MDPYVRDQLTIMKQRLVKNIELVGKHKLEDLMDPEIFQSTAVKLATIEADDLHFMGCFESAERETTVDAFEERIQSLLAAPYDTNVSANPVVQRCKEYCRAQFNAQEPDASINDSQEIAITEAQIATTDPFTKRRLIHPLVNRKCDHIYERATIHELLTTNRRLKCPVIGCRNRDFITMNDLHEDPYITMQLQAQNQGDNGNDSADETIEDTDTIPLNDTMPDL